MAKNILGLSGVGNDIKHQLIISYLIYHLMDKFFRFSKYKKYVALPEYPIYPYTEKTPDIVIIFNLLKPIPKVIIEVNSLN